MTALRMIRLDEVDLVAAWHLDAAAGSEFQWSGFRSAEPLRRSVADGTVITEDRGQLAVVDDEDSFVGGVSWHTNRTGSTAASWCWMIGIVIDLAHRGRGHGSAAQRALADYLFAHTAAWRVEADTDVDNIAEQRSLEKAGFVREGVRRGSQWRLGSWHDTVVYARLRNDP